MSSPVDNLAERARLLRTLPTLLKNLRSGLNKIGFNPFDLNQLFSDLEQIHLQRLKNEETVDLGAPADSGLSGQGSTSTLVRPEIPIVAPRKAPAQTLDEVLASRQQRSEVVAPETIAPAVSDLEDLDRELAAHFGEGELSEGVDAAVAQADTATNCSRSTATGGECSR